MEKNDMSVEQLEARNKFVETLKKAGWEEGGFNEFFEEGLSVPEEAHMEYHKGEMDLIAIYLAEPRVIDFSLEHGRNSIRLNIEFKDGLNDLLEVMAGFQDKISPQNYKTHLREMLRVCPTIFVVQGEEGEDLIPLTDTKGGWN